MGRYVAKFVPCRGEAHFEQPLFSGTLLFYFELSTIASWPPPFSLMREIFGLTWCRDSLCLLESAWSEISLFYPLFTVTYS